MNCLPIVNRELRVAARKRSTFWLRVVAALTALVIGSGCMLFSLVPGFGTFQMGSVLFNVLTWLCLAAGLSAGLFFTSDCLSEEKREGTLGLLQADVDRDPGGDIAAAVTAESVGDGKCKTNWRDDRGLCEIVLGRRSYKWRPAVDRDPAETILVVLANGPDHRQACVLDCQRVDHGFHVISVGILTSPFEVRTGLRRPRRDISCHDAVPGG